MGAINTAYHPKGPAREAKGKNPTAHPSDSRAYPYFIVPSTRTPIHEVRNAVKEISLEILCLSGK